MSMKKIIGIDLGGTTAKIGILNQSGEIEKKWELPTDISEEGSLIVPNIIQSIHEVLESENLAVSDFLGIGMGTPGTVNRNDGTVIGAYNLNWKTEQLIREQVESGTGIPFFLDNDANVAALGEQWKGAGNNEKNVSFITLGTGVGGGLVSDGNLIHGAIDAAGEVGHITVEPYGYECTCGKKGCLEQYASATGIVRLARDLAVDYTEESELKVLVENDEPIDAKRVFDFAKAGDAYANHVVDKVSFYLGLALGNIANILNPSTIVLGGGVSQAGDFLVEKVSKVVEEFTFPTIRSITKIKIAELGNDAGMIGAASLVINELDNNN